MDHTPLSFVDLYLLDKNGYQVRVTSTFNSSYTPGYETSPMQQVRKYQHHLYSLGYDAPWGLGLWVVRDTQE